MSDYELTLKIRNAPLLAWMRSYGIKTVSDLIRASGVSREPINDILSLRSPLYREASDGTVYVAPSVLRLAEFFVCSPEELYPESHWHTPLVQNTFTANVSREQFAAMEHKSSGDPLLFLEALEEDRSEEMERAIIERLAPKEQSVIRWRFFENKSRECCAQELGCTRERVRQIEGRALRKLRQKGWLGGEVLKHEWLRDDA